MPVPGPDKVLCGAQRPNQPAGVTCKLVAGHGTDHLGIGSCYRHGGRTETHKRSADLEKARRGCEKLGLRVEVHPAVALVEEVYRAAANVDFYERLVAELPTHPDPDEYIEGEDGAEGHWERGAPGVYGRTYHVSGIPTGEAKPHILVQLYNDERAMLVRATTAALKAGVDERRVQIAMNDAGLLAEAFRGFAVALGHNPADKQVREVFRAQLKLVAGGRTA